MSRIRAAWSELPNSATDKVGNETVSLIGSLLYASSKTRPDIAFAVGMLCRAMGKPSTELMDAGLRVLAYLHHHKGIGLRYEDDQRELSGMSDASWAVRHSTSGYVLRRSSLP